MDRPRNQPNEPDVSDMISVLTVNTDVLPFPYDSEYSYALQMMNGNVCKSKVPMYIIKTSNRDYVLVYRDDVTNHAFSPTWANIELSSSCDTSELGNGVWYKKRYSNEKTSWGVCNYPVQEVRYNEDYTKLYVVRE